MDVFVRLMNALLMIAIPIGLGMILYRRWALSWKYFFIGAATFIGSQVLHIPFNLFVLVPIADKLDLIGSERFISLMFYALLLGFSAGVFEEGARYIVYRSWLKDVSHWKEAVFFGAGHGGVEAVMLGGLALFAFFQATAYREADLMTLVSPEQVDLLQSQLDAYWTAPWYAAILGAAERSLAIVIQISLAVMVFRAVADRKVLWLVLAVAWHTVVDAMAVLGLQYWGVYLTEGVLIVLAGVSLVGTLLLRKKEAPENQEHEKQIVPIPEILLPSASIEMDLSKNRLDDSRYDS